MNAYSAPRSVPVSRLRSTCQPNQVQSNTFAAFEMYAVQGRPVKEVADFLNMSVNSVYVAKNR